MTTEVYKNDDAERINWRDPNTAFEDGLEKLKAEARLAGEAIRRGVREAIEKQLKSADNVNHPSHYCDGKIEVIDYIEDKKLGYHLGNVVKYISRAGKKCPDKEIEDLKKASWYLNRYIERLESASEKRVCD